MNAWERITIPQPANDNPSRDELDRHQTLRVGLLRNALRMLKTVGPSAGAAGGAAALLAQFLKSFD